MSQRIISTEDVTKMSVDAELKFLLKAHTIENLPILHLNMPEAIRTPSILKTMHYSPYSEPILTAEGLENMSLCDSEIVTAILDCDMMDLLFGPENERYHPDSTAISTPTSSSTKEDVPCSSATTLQNRTATTIDNSTIQKHCEDTTKSNHQINVTGTSSYTRLLPRFRIHKLNKYVLLIYQMTRPLTP